MRVVLDTNVLISGVFWKGNESKVLEMCQRRDIENHISNDILEELVQVLAHPKFELTEQEIEVTASMIAGCSVYVEPKTRLEFVKEDPGDDKFLECAYECDAEYIISGDKHLLNLERFKAISILSAREFLKVV